MMKNLSRAPTKTERAIAVVVAALATLAFGAIAAFILLQRPVSVAAAATFSALFLGSATMFFRAAFTARRSLSPGETRGLCWALLIGGIAVTPLALWAGPSTQGLMLLGAGLASAAYGLAGLSLRR